LRPVPHKGNPGAACINLSATVRRQTQPEPVVGPGGLSGGPLRRTGDCCGNGVIPQLVRWPRQTPAALALTRGKRGTGGGDGSPAPSMGWRGGWRSTVCPARLPSGWMGGWADATSYAPGQGAHRLEPDDVPDDLGLLNQARARPVAPLRSGRGNQAGPFPGAMIIATVPGPRAGERMRRGEDS